MADCVREGIDLFLRQTESSTADLSRIAGRFPARSGSDLKPHDQWWADSAVKGRPKSKR